MTIPLKFLITSFLEAPVLPEATVEVLAIPLVWCSVIDEKLALLSCRVSSDIIRLALWLYAVRFKCLLSWSFQPLVYLLSTIISYLWLTAETVMVYLKVIYRLSDSRNNY